MKIIVIGAPESLPPELAENPDVIVVDPASLPEEMIQMLDAATGGMLAEDGEETEESGEGPLSEWAGEEEKEHGMGGYGDDTAEDDDTAGKGEDEDPMGKGEDDDDERPIPPASATRGKGGKRGGSFGVTISGRGAAIPALSQWARSMGRAGTR